ncbi:MAG: ATP-binding cassette domain-containing protein [Propioniciclava sp.]|uniref:ATP-binding cassette domain-containing protein n=1 Tax=Propioniciclava sp. TaxID=2038686 RepID=UPI0039E3A0DF
MTEQQTGKHPLLRLDGVSVNVGGTTVCHEVSIAVREGETHVLLGHNGSGKSSLLNAIMGTGPFQVSSGRIEFAGIDITEASVTERARLGLGMAAQRPPQLPGVTVAKLAHAIGRDEHLQAAAETMRLGQLVPRDVNVGFSGGETKRWEVMKLLLQQPTLCLFDEPESGVDLEHVAVVGKAIRGLLDTPTADGRPRGALIITHTGFILDHLDTAIGHTMTDGRIVETGDAHSMFERMRRQGFAA